jgi:uncharacterized repeat protein (TIGR03806 family)
MNGSDAINTTSFNTGLHWTGGAAPAGGNTYQTSTFLLRTPSNNIPVTFAGDSLELQSGGGELRIKTMAPVTINNLILDNGAILDLTAPTGAAPTGSVQGNMTLNGTVTFEAGLSTDANGSSHVLTVNSAIGGSGGFTTTGSFGTIIFSAMNSFSGASTVTAGTVLINGVAAGPVTITGGTLGGNGLLKGAVSSQSTGTLLPGLGGTDTSTLVISNNLNLAGTTVMTLNRNNAQNSSRISGVATLTQGGTLIVTNAGPALQAGDTFTLFSAASYPGAFSSVTLPALAGNLTWNNTLSVNGTLTVIGTTFPVITNLPASSVFATFATLNGQVISSGVSTPSVTIYYGTNDGATSASAWSNNISIGQATGFFSAPVSGLKSNTTYYFTAFASNSAGAVWAAPSKNFSTPASNPLVTPVQVLTYHYDNTRQGANTNETLLTLSNVNTNSFGKLFSYAVDGYIYTEPLIMTNLAIPGQGIHDVVFIATEHGTVYAFDANSNAGANGGLIWKTNLGISALSANGEFGTRYCITCYPDIVPEVSITGTPVIDPATGTLYVNVFTREVSGTTNYIHRIHAIDVTTGSERSYSPVVVAGSFPGHGRDSVGGLVPFQAKLANQRPALCLANGMLFVAYAGYADTDPYHGWLFGYNATNLALQTNFIFNTTPNATTAAFGGNAAEGGIWQGGGGLCVDGSNNLYFETGNGSFSQNTNGGDYADSFMRISTTNGFAVADYFTPFDQASLASADTDLGSCGPLLLPDSVGSLAHPHLLVGIGKSGKAYLLDRDVMTTGNIHYQSGSDSEIIQSFLAVGGTWSPPSYWNGLIYFQPSSGAMKSFRISNGSINTTANATSPASMGSYNGGPVISANGTNNGIVWVINGNSGNTGSAGTLYALNATNISQMLWSSAQFAARDSVGPAIKMTTPTVAGGKVYMPAQYTLSVYGVNTFLAIPVIAPNGGVFTNSVLVTITDATPGTTIYYTLDGTPPTASSILYTGPFVVSNTVSVQAVATKSGAVNSAVAVASFINSSSIGNGTGLTGAYYSNHTAASPFTGPPTLVRTDSTIDFDWGSGSPDPSISVDSFTARWTGSVQPQFNETYTFYATTDDGVRVWVNGQLIIDEWVDQAPTTSAGSISLKAQQLYNITMEYYENGGGAAAQLAWSSPSTPQAIIPQSQLYPYTNPPPSVAMISPADGAPYTATASVTVTADADAPYNPISSVNLYMNGGLLGSISNAPYTITTTGLAAGGYSFTAVATDGSGLGSTSAPVSITVNSGSGQPYGLNSRANVPAYYNMPTTSGGSLPALLSQTGVFSDTPDMTPDNGLIPYTPNTPLWSDGALKTRYMGVPNNGGLLTPDQQIGFAPAGSWTFPAGSVFVKTFELNTDTTNPNVRRRLETRLLVRDINGAVYGVTYKWRPDNSDADLLASSLLEDIIITNASGLSTQTWYYPSPSDCLQCHTPVAKYVLGLSTRQLNGNQTYPSTGITDNQIRTFNRIGLLNPSIDEAAISGYEKLSSLTNTLIPAEDRARSYLDANCAQCHQPGGAGITFDARYETPLASQNITNYPAAYPLGYDNARIIASKDIWRSMIYQRMNTTNNPIKMPPLARALIDTNAVEVMTEWINGLPGIPSLAPPSIVPNGGTFISAVGVTLQAPDTNATIYYSLDGSLPTTSSFLYSGTFSLSSNAIISASAFETGSNNSVATTALFLIQPPLFTSQGFSNNVFYMGFLGASGINYVLQGSTNLEAWTPIATNFATTNQFYFPDSDATNFSYRFYRVLQQ